MTPSFKALVFDLDGTLVDSSGVVRKVMEAWCNKNGIPLQSVLDVCQGARTEDTISLIAPHLCAKSEAAEIEFLESRTLDGITPILDADRFLNHLVSDMWAIVTSSSILTAKPKLEICGMPNPPVFITAESVNHGKPNPEPFLAAAKELGIRPDECLVFEDADNGVRSALSAGCRIIIVGDSSRIDHPHIVGRIDSFVDVEFTSEGNLKIRDEIIKIIKTEPNNAMDPTPAAHLGR